jgi:zinc protease
MRTPDGLPTPCAIGHLIHMKIPIDRRTLPNGLTVILSEDHTTPVVAVNLWYHVGSANERAGRTGFAHLFEHMLFQGSANVEANEHFELVQRAGGTLNGSTWLDRTNYYETMPSNQLGIALWLEADRMARLLPAMTQEKLDTQRDVVKNERRWSVDNQPYGDWWERLPALCFPPSHPFHHSLIGSFEDLDAASLDDVREFFATWYVPDNAVLTICGDFDPHEAMAMVTSLFGPIPRGGARPALPPMELPTAFGEAPRSIVPAAVPATRVLLASRIPPYASDGWYAASLLSTVLGVRAGSRLTRALVREQRLAADAGAFTFDLAKGTDLLVCDVTGHPDTDADALEAALHAELDRVMNDGIAAPELARALALVETGFAESLQSAGTRADMLSRYATYLGDPEHVNHVLDHYRTVTVQQVNALARERLGVNNRAVLRYEPAGEDVAVAA